MTGVNDVWIKMKKYLPLVVEQKKITLKREDAATKKCVSMTVKDNYDYHVDQRLVSENACSDP